MILIRTATASLMAAMLAACTVTPPKTEKPAGDNVALNCGALPVTEHLWGESYHNMAGSKVDPDWGQPIYEGFATGAMVLATPLYLVADVLVAPVRLVQPCVEPAPPPAAAAPAPKKATARPAPARPAPATRPSYRRPAPPPPQSGGSYYRSRPAPRPPVTEPEPEGSPY